MKIQSRKPYKTNGMLLILEPFSHKWSQKYKETIGISSVSCCDFANFAKMRKKYCEFAKVAMLGINLCIIENSFKIIYYRAFEQLKPSHRSTSHFKN